MNLSSLVPGSARLFGGSEAAAVVTSDSPAGEGTVRLGDGRFATVVDIQAIANGQPPDDNRVAKLLEEKMALVPAGITLLQESGSVQSFDLDLAAEPTPQHPVHVESFFIDRFAVTNAEFHSFVAAGGYRQMDLWPQEIWPSVLRLVDQTNNPGPRFWSNGRPPRDLTNHPVVGVCWYEAAAYARWVGKQLPSSGQWQHAGTWSISGDPQLEAAKYPWGHGIDGSRANTWAAGLNRTTAVNEYYAGCTPNGIYQLIGNVWEWVSTRYSPVTGTSESAAELAEIRGGAFDTYFDSQASCYFRTGQSLMYRAANVGFRCCLTLSQHNQEN